MAAASWMWNQFQAAPHLYHNELPGTIPNSSHQAHLQKALVFYMLACDKLETVPSRNVTSPGRAEPSERVLELANRRNFVTAMSGAAVFGAWAQRTFAQSNGLPFKLSLMASTFVLAKA